MTTASYSKKYIGIGIALAVCLILVILFHYAYPSKETLTDEAVTSILEKTWEQLDASEQIEIANGVSDGSVEKRIFTDNKDSPVQLFYLPEEYYGKEVYIVTFTSQKRDLLGDIIKIVDKESGLIVGFNFRS